MISTGRARGESSRNGFAAGVIKALPLPAAHSASDLQLMTVESSAAPKIEVKTTVSDEQR